MRLDRLQGLLLLMGCILSSSAKSGPSNQWQVWLQLGHVLLDTQQKAIDLAEAIVRARSGQAEVEEERPFVAADEGEAWKVSGTNGGTHTEIPFVRVVSVVTLQKTTGQILNYQFQGSMEDIRTLGTPPGTGK